MCDSFNHAYDSVFVNRLQLPVITVRLYSGHFMTATVVLQFPESHDENKKKNRLKMDYSDVMWEGMLVSCACRTLGLDACGRHVLNVFSAATIID